MQPQSTRKTVKIILLRHAESKYNVLAYGQRKTRGLNTNVEELCDLRWIRDPDLLDADLTEIGIKQAEEAIPKVNAYDKLKYVISSPLQRATNTAIISVGKHPNPLQWRWIPEFREALCSNCDVANHTKDLKEKHDFFQADDEFYKDPVWFLRHIPELEGSSEFAKQAIKVYEDSEDFFAVTQFMKSIYPYKLESFRQIRARIENGKERLRNFLRSRAEAGEEVQDLELILVAHSIMIKTFTATEFSETGLPLNGTHLQNAELMEFDLEY